MNNSNLTYIIICGVCFMITLVIHFRLIENLSREDKMVQFFCLNLATTFLIFIIFKINKKLVIGPLIPYFYLVNAFFFRVLFSNLVFKILKIKFLKLPPNPTIVYSGGVSLGIRWKNQESYKPLPIEYIYSIIILVLPFYELSFVGKLI